MLTKNELTDVILDFLRRKGPAIGTLAALDEARDALAEAQKRAGYEHPGKLEYKRPLSAW